MFFNKSAKLLKQKEEELLITQTTLRQKEEALSVSESALKQKTQEVTTTLAELQQTKETLEKCNDLSNELKRKYQPLINIDEILQQKEIEIGDVKEAIKVLNEKYKAGLTVHATLESEIGLYEDKLEISTYGLYAPQFNFDTSEKFKEVIEANYEEQKVIVKNDKAIVCHMEWIVGGSKAEGKKMTNQYKKLMLFAFNGECEGLIAKVKWNNSVKSKERILKAFENINKLGASHNIEITNEFLQLKLKELSLTYEYEQKKYEEKEEQKRIREQMREEEKAQREFERAQKEAEDEEGRFQKALEKAQKELDTTSQADMELLNERIKTLEQNLQEAHAKKERAIAMAQLTKVGHIYIISNIGAFGEDVYKMGMTRRLDPLDRVKELGDASVPFQFDVHAIIYSDNAPQLEYELHQKFGDRRLNRVNAKKEFFRVSLDEIETFVLQHTGATIEFTKLAEARDYRETLTILAQLNKVIEVQKEETKFPTSLDF